MRKNTVCQKTKVGFFIDARASPLVFVSFRKHDARLLEQADKVNELTLAERL